MKSSDPSPGAVRADSDLLRAFASGRDEAAFRALTERYAGLVYGIAFRRLMNAGAAQEVASEVFTMLAWKAPRLTRSGCLAAWLQRSAVLITANAARRDTRRRLAMRAYTASLDPSPSPPPSEDEAWGEALEHLDESLARLPDRDRQLLLARYFTGRTYGEIAEEMAAGEEAVKKAGQRALRRLRALLVRRGVTLSAAVLASGLTRHVQAATPEGVPFQAASTAFRAAAPSGLLSTVQHTLAYMFYGKTLTAASAALLLCAALGGGSFLTARQLAMAFSGPPPGGASMAVEAMPAAGSDGSATGESASRGGASIMREAVELLRRSRRDGSPEMDRAILLLAGLSPEEMRTAAQEAEIHRGDRPLAGALAIALGAAWAERDPAAALAWLETFPGPPEWPVGPNSHRIAGMWFARDGRAAWDWWMACRRRSDYPFRPSWEYVLGESVGGWAGRDPVAATAAMGEINASPQLLQGFASQLRQMALEADSPVIGAVLKWENASMRVRLAGMLAGGLDPFGQGAQELDRVFSVLNRLCADQPGAMEAVAAPLMPRWVAEAPEKAVEWILHETAPTAASTRQLLEPALRTWGEKSPSEAWRWMQGGITADPARADRFYGALLDSRQVPEPSDGTVADRWLSRAWADQIASASQESREPFLRYWAGQWLEFAASRGITVDEALARWRHRIRVAEVSESAASARLAGQALQMAEATVSGMAPAVPVPDSPSSSPSTPPAAATGSPILTR